MPQVDFYSLKQRGEQERLLFACRLTEKAMQQGLKIYIHADTEQEAQEMDDLLWSFRPESFIPHAIVGIDEELTEDEDIPVFIGCSTDFNGKADLLINLARDIPTFHGDFARIAEIVPDVEAAKANLREHWNAYKTQGYTLEHHQL